MFREFIAPNMNRALLLVTSLLILSSVLPAQNHLFIPFGQTVADVEHYLYTRDYVANVELDDSMKTLRALIDADNQVEYAFNEGNLYAITVSRNYRNRRQARESLKNCLNYMAMVSHGAMRETNDERLTCHTAITDSRIVKLFIQEHSRSTTITITTLSRSLGTLEQEEAFLYELDLLQRQYISN